MIGGENRVTLRSLEVAMPKPKQLWQHKDGTCTSLEEDWRLNEVVARPVDVKSVEGRLVDHLGPAIEACFCILGFDRSELSLNLVLESHLLPGVQVLSDEQLEYVDEYQFNFNPKLPIFIEKSRDGLTSGVDGSGQVDVL